MRPTAERCKGRLPGSSETDSRHQGLEERQPRRYHASVSDGSLSSARSTGSPGTIVLASGLPRRSRPWWRESDLDDQRSRVLEHPASALIQASFSRWPLAPRDSTSGVAQDPATARRSGDSVGSPQDGGPDGVAVSARSERHMHMHQHTDAEQGSTIFDMKVREVAKRLDIPAAQVRDVFAAYDAITMEWAHSDEELGGSWTTSERL